MSHKSKRMKKVYEGLNLEKDYALEEGILAIKERAKAKFDETIELAVNLAVDTKKSDQAIRGVIQLPNGTGKSVRVGVFARDARADEARAAGADVVGAEDLADKIQAGEINFERLIATPDMMPLVGRLGRVLGPKGLMPNPKLGTVTMDVSAAIKAAKGGQIEYRAEKAGIVHASVGKASFDTKALAENIKVLMDALIKARPAGTKGTYVKRVHLSPTMGPSVALSLSELT
jgi:large subunit ribosomal protein L1